MNSLSWPHLEWTTISLIGSLLVILATAILGWIAWRASGWRRSIGLLELFRFALVCLVALLFNQPEWIEQFRPREKPTVYVLADRSPSMETRDVLPEEGDPAMGTAAQTRLQALAPLLDPESWKSVSDRLEVVIQPIAEPQAGHGTDLTTPLAAVLEQGKNVRGVVLASDGDWNEGSPPAQAAAKLRLAGVPVFGVPVGNRTRLPDLELLTLDVPTFGIAGKSVRIPFTIDSSLPREQTLTVVLKTSDGDDVSREVRVSAMGRTSDSLTWKPRSVGDFSVTLSVPAQSDELLTENNSLTAPISIREEKLRVLVVESVPRWEYRYLRNALSRDPGVEVSCLLFHPGLSKVGGGNKDYLKQFPTGLDELSKYDVVFIGDVGAEEGQLTAEQCRWLKGLVEQQASGLVFLPGFYGRQFSLLETELGELCPVILDEGQPGGWGSRVASHFELTELGRRSLLTRLADTADENLEVWEGLPGFQWYAPVLRAKPGSEVLSVHKDASNEYGRLPLLVTRTFGAGKVLFMGTDGAWRWRKGVEDKYHYRFWGQVVRWMAYQRNMAKGETMRLYYSPDQPQLRQSLALNANVMDRGGEPLTAGEVSARITAPSGKSDTVQLTSEGDEWGLFTGRYTPVEPGRHEVKLTSKTTGGSLDATFFVQGEATERIGKPARPEVLEEVARITRGRVLSPRKWREVVQSLADLPEPPAIERRLQLWSHPAVMGTLIALLSLFWALRKYIGLF
ncbi:MAG: hypothetical protein ACK50P_03325 [Planctomycetaceae bacterium]|jgi:hypothetical protein